MLYSRLSSTVLLVMFIFCGFLSNMASADLLEDFDSLTVGVLNGQDGWSASLDSARVVPDYTRGGNVLRQVGNGISISKPLDAMSIANGDTGTLFFRFLATTSDANHGVGLSDVVSPTEWTDYEATALMFNDGTDAKVRGRDGAAYVDLTENGGASGLDINTWYDTWVVIDNAADTADFYIRGGAISTQRKVGTALNFRNGTTNTLGSLLLRVGTTDHDALLVDDIHVTNGVSLSTPSAQASASLNVSQLTQFAGTSLLATDNAIAVNRYPSVTTTAGAWTDTAASTWTAGFLPGSLWQMYGATGVTDWRTRAESRMAALESRKNDDTTHDLGFVVFNSFGQGYKLTGNTAYRDVVNTASDTLSTRYSSTVGAIQSWGDKDTGDFEVIIDNMMNLEMLFWSSKNGGDPNHYNIAVQHAYTTMQEHVRPDGSTFHVVEFDRATGDVILKRTHQGYADDSTWSRGEAWGLYGFTMCYRETGNADFLATAELIADYTLNNLPPGGVPYYDYDDPATPPPHDSSAAAVTASALLELATLVADQADRDRYIGAAEEILLTLAGPAFLSDGTDFESILMNGTVRQGQSDMGLIYGDYYFIEALQRYEAVPEPASLLVLLVGVPAALRYRRRRKAESKKLAKG